MKTHDEIIAEAQRRHPHNHTVDDPFGATGEAESDPYGYEETARLAFIAGGAYTLEGAPDPAGGDERGALESAQEMLRHYGYGHLADALDGFRRPSTPTEEQVKNAMAAGWKAGPVGSYAWMRAALSAVHPEVTQ